MLTARCGLTPLYIIQVTCQVTDRSVRVRFVVDQVALGQGFLPVLLFSPVSIFSPMLHIHLLVAVSRTTGEAWGNFPALTEVGKRWIESKIRGQFT